MAIKIGSRDVLARYIGTRQVLSVKVGTRDVYSGDTTLPVRNIILLGASIENFTFNTAADTTDIQSRIAAAVPAAAGQVTFYNESVNGRTVDGAKTHWDGTIRAKYSTGGATPLPYDSSTMVLLMCYGNDITNMKPYGASDDALIATINADLTAIINDCNARGWDWHIVDISWRDYGNNCFEDESAGAAPFRDRIAHALNLSLTHPYKNRFYPDGTSWLDYYHLWMRHASFLTDEVHNAPGVMSNPIRQEIVDKIVVPSWTKSPPVSTKFTLPEIGSDAIGSQCVWVVYDPTLKTVRSNACAMGKDSARGDLGRDTVTGSYLPSVFRKVALPTSYNTGGNAALTVPGHFDAGDLSHSLYCQGTTVAKFAVKRLTPGASYELVMSGSRGSASTDTTRMTRIDIVTGTPTSGGSSQQYSASNPASGTIANYVTFVVTPNASGVIEFELSNDDRTSGSRYGYLGALSVKRVA
ncbi:hypothetical protein [Uliginosibacterium sp. 31-12]|uniref:hypothetical protein n=1 Tax=Uliginosibacterium sp. 31-12 TaxID=3062781 RepID=UPI0026E2A0C8|nr:hypothetical protein [Uliginosibacterium sp. 31-12]MDO6385568.1 hypothetical protein [Uliginosibacterium sp. 31-12]